jgi:putative ABC transport system permease protein
VLTELLQEQADAQRAFSRLLTGFMGLGLMVGIASLGVISLRAVVERRQQIGVLRAIGYRKRMVQLSFLLESSFVALLGIGIGVGLGTILSYNLVTDIQKDVASIRFTVPWLQIGIIIAIAYVFSLVTTFLPARQASEIYPAEALRYE